MTEREAYIAFNLLPDTGAVKVARLAERFGGVAAAWENAPGERLDRNGEPVEWKREIDRAEKMKVALVTLADDGYPAILREIASPPLVLYVAGAPAALCREGVAIVGTRRPTLYGTETAQRFAAALCETGRAVYSGLAAGIDAAAHRGALQAHGITAGILGGALDRFYPKENTRLAREIVDAGGAVASEFPFGRRPDAQTFPQRNRIVAGLSRATVAIEAPLQSGTLITCRLAAEQGRAVLAVPGRIDSRNSQGCLHLIREGALLATCVEDVIEAVTPVGTVGRECGSGKPAAASSPEPPAAAITLEESLVLRALPPDGASVDDVAKKTGFDAAKTNSLLVRLRLKRKCRFLPGNRVMPA